MIRCLSIKNYFVLFFLGSKQKKREIIYLGYFLSNSYFGCFIFFFLYHPTGITFDKTSLILIVKVHLFIDCLPGNRLSDMSQSHGHERIEGFVNF